MLKKHCPAIPNPYPGIFIVFEGIDGCGKSEQLKRTYGWLNSNDSPLRHCRIEQTKEPNKSRHYGKKIYQDLADRSEQALHKRDPHAFQTWYARDSKEHLAELVIPSIQAASVVLSDRFRPSMVYGAQEPAEIPILMARNREIIGEDFIWPDLVIVLDIAVDAAIGRLKEKNRELDEHEKSEVLHRVRQNYLHFALMYSNCHVVGAEEPIEEVFARVKQLVLETLEFRANS